ncbi:MAG: hypothetical protein V4760_18545 [Bdellovibrionota bacterium]
MRIPWIVLFILLLGPVAEARIETCAYDSLGLKRTPALEQFRKFLDSDHVGLANETAGSYVILDLFSDHMTIAFYTSGLFDLVPIKREGPVQFCDVDGALEMRGLERVQKIRIVDGKLVIDEGGPKKTFVKGEMPAPLARLHHYQGRAVAADPRGSAPHP